MERTSNRAQLEWSATGTEMLAGGLSYQQWLHCRTAVPQEARGMKFNRILASGIAVIIALGGASAVVASHDDPARDQLRRVESQTRDLVPVFTDQLNLERNRDSNPGYNNDTRGDNEIRAMMALGGFSGEANAFYASWDRYPDAPLGAALSELDRSFRSADQWIRRSPRSRDVSRRWRDIRQSYFRFRQDLADSPFASGGYDNQPQQGDQGYQDDPWPHQPQITIHQGD
jgi:hypothetical protein